MSKTPNSFLIILLLITTIGCGTIIGNGITDPTSPVGQDSVAPQPDLDFSAPVQEFEQNSFASCGKFTEESSVAELDAGRACIHDAFNSCTPKKYLYNKLNSDGSRFVSFVNIDSYIPDPTKCQINIHTVSNVPPANIGDVTRNCTTLDTNEIPEVACGIQ